MSEDNEVRRTVDDIVMLERKALDRWGKGDPGGFLELYGADVTYFDPLTALRIDGHQSMVDYYRPYTEKIRIARFEMLNPKVAIEGNMALLTYNLVNYITDNKGLESVGSRWNSTVVYRRRGDSWKTIHSHWSFTMHPAFQGMTAEATEGLNA
jgi:ketosteroid isomerase-like protein